MGDFIFLKLGGFVGEAPFNSPSHSKSTADALRCRPGGVSGDASASVSPSEPGRHRKAPRGTVGDRAALGSVLLVPGGPRVRYGGSGTGLAPAQPPTNPGLSSHGLAWPRGPIPPAPEAARSGCRPGASRQPDRRGSAPQPPRSRSPRPRPPARPHLTRSLQLQPLPVHPQPPQAPAPAARELPRAQGVRLAHSPLGTGAASAQQRAQLQPRLQPPSRVPSSTITKAQAEAIAREPPSRRERGPAPGLGRRAARVRSGKTGGGRAAERAGERAGRAGRAEHGQGRRAGSMPEPREVRDASSGPARARGKGRLRE